MPFGQGYGSPFATNAPLNGALAPGRSFSFGRGLEGQRNRLSASRGEGFGGGPTGLSSRPQSSFDFFGGFPEPEPEPQLPFNPRGEDESGSFLGIEEGTLLSSGLGSNMYRGYDMSSLGPPPAPTRFPSVGHRDNVENFIDLLMRTNQFDDLNYFAGRDTGWL